MEEQLVSFETAKLAKEKGINIPSHSYYFEDGEFKEFKICDTYGYYGEEYTIDRGEFYNNWNDEWLTKKSGERCFGCDKANGYFETFSAPTQSLLQKWLREEHNIDVEARLVERLNTRNYLIKLYKNNTPVISSIFHFYKTYEEALELGLIEALNLIK